MLLSDNTLWIFLLAYFEDADNRFISDITNGVICLENNGIKSENIHLLIDDRRNTAKGYITDFVKESNIKNFGDYYIESPYNLKNIIKNSSHENIVIFVVGHGCKNGIRTDDKENPIKPYQFIQDLKSNKTSKNIVVYLSQCFAGIFNHINIVNNKPNILFVGATDLHPSISHKQNADSWSANLFLLYLFDWINKLSPEMDIDGDGEYTVIDSYKYAGIMTNNCCSGYKTIAFEEALDWVNIRRKELTILSELYRNNCPINLIALQTRKVEAIERKLESIQDIHYNIQEPWISNPELAIKLKFK